jgi:molecular chaperone DnaK
VVDDFQRKHRVDLAVFPQAMQDLLLECERAKRRLGRMAKTAIRVQAAGRDHQVELTRERFEELTAHLLQATKLTTEVAVRDAGLSWDRIGRVLLVGGSTHMPAVRSMLRDLSGKPPDTGVNPVVAVSLGAAIYAHMLETGHALMAVQQRPTIEPEEEPAPAQVLASTPPSAAEHLPAAEELPAPPPLPAMPTVRFVTAHGVGLRVRANQGYTNKVLIPKNTRVPVSITKRFLTKSVGPSGNRIRIEITQGDTRDLNLAERLGTGKIRGLPPNEPDGQPVDVTMHFDEQGRLHISARYVPRNQEMEMTLEIPGGLREEEVQQHRRYLEETGFFPSTSISHVIETLDDDDNGDDIPLLEPIE